MTADARLGLLVGVAVVLAAAFVYYGPDGVQAKNTDPDAAVRTSAADDLYRTVQLSPAADERR